MEPGTCEEHSSTDSRSSRRTRSAHDDDPHKYFAELPTPTFISGIVCAVAVASIFFVLLCVFFKRKSKSRPLTEEEVTEFFHGINPAHANSRQSVHPNSFSADILTFPNEYQIPDDAVHLYVDEEIGKGTYGVYVRGEYEGKPVAVKVIKTDIDVEIFKDFLQQVKLMAYVGTYTNIVGFYGAVVDDLSQRFCETVLELSPFGDLRTFLKKNMESRTLSSKSFRKKTLTLKQQNKLQDMHLVSFCAQIAAGMEYLSQKKVVHADLSARNVLVFENFVVKIRNFGKSTHMAQDRGIIKRSRMLSLPWRWMAPESIKHSEFSTKSDVWSYGITAWEIFTMGNELPYADINWSSNFTDQLDNEQFRLPKPRRGSEYMYTFLKRCWNIIPERRPTFGEAKFFFRQLLYIGDDYVDCGDIGPGNAGASKTQVAIDIVPKLVTGQEDVIDDDVFESPSYNYK